MIMKMNNSSDKLHMLCAIRIWTEQHIHTCVHACNKAFEVAKKIYMHMHSYNTYVHIFFAHLGCFYFHNTLRVGKQLKA